MSGPAVADGDPHMHSGRPQVGGQEPRALGSERGRGFGGGRRRDRETWRAVGEARASPFRTLAVWPQGSPFVEPPLLLCTSRGLWGHSAWGGP